MLDDTVYDLSTLLWLSSDPRNPALHLEIQKVDTKIAPPALGLPPGHNEITTQHLLELSLSF